jgi:hypothetical protein
MRNICAIGLTVLVCAQPMVALAADDGGSPGPLGRSVSREAARLAAEPAGRAATHGWEALRGLDPGTRIIVTTANTTLTATFVSANDTTLNVRNGDAPELLNAEDVVFVAHLVRRGSAGAAVLGTLGGIWLGAVLAVGLAENTRCYGDCGAARLGFWSAIVGVPILGGYGAWYGTSRVTEEIIYRRP